MPLPTIPPTEVPDPAGDYSRAQSWALLLANHANAGNWATWAATIMESGITDITRLLGSDTVAADLNAMIAELGTLVSSNPGTISGTGAGFSDTLLTNLKARLVADIATSSTGLGNAEAGLFARDTARQNAIRAQAFKEISSAYSSNGWDMPPGALLSDQETETEKSAIQLSDSSSQIMAESARLAVQYNLGVINASTQLLDMLSRVYESEEMRKFEASKASVMLAVENYKSYLDLYSTKADIAIKKAGMVLDNKARQLALEVTTLQGISQSAQQIIASALNGLHTSSTFNWSGSAPTSYDGT